MKFKLNDRVTINIGENLLTGYVGTVVGLAFSEVTSTYIVLLDNIVDSPLFGETKAVIIPESNLFHL